MYRNLSHRLKYGVASTPKICRSYATSSDKPIDPYTVLNVQRTANAKQIKARYYELSKQFHPDSARSSSEDIAKFHSISEAYNILSDVTKRAEYDRLVGAGDSFSRRAQQPSSRPFAGHRSGVKYDAYAGESEKWRHEYDDMYRDPYTGERKFDEGHWDRQYINFVRFQEKMRQRRNSPHRSASSQSWSHYEPMADQRFESFYRESPRVRYQRPQDGIRYEERLNDRRPPPSVDAALRAEDEATEWARQKMEGSVYKKNMIDMDDERTRREMQDWQQNKAVFSCVLIAVLIATLLFEARTGNVRGYMEEKGWASKSGEAQK